MDHRDNDRFGARRPSVASGGGQQADQTQPATRQPGGGNRRHMGVATSDPQYLPVTEPEGRGGRPHTRPAIEPVHAPEATRHQGVDYSRYLSTPKRGKSIFISRYDRERIRTRRFLMLAAIVLVVALAVWFVVLR